VRLEQRDGTDLLRARSHPAVQHPLRQHFLPPAGGQQQRAGEVGVGVAQLRRKGSVRVGGGGEGVRPLVVEREGGPVSLCNAVQRLVWRFFRFEYHVPGWRVRHSRARVCGLRGLGLNQACFNMKSDHATA